MLTSLIMSIFISLTSPGAADMQTSAPPEGHELVIGRSYTIPSKAFAEDRELLISVPDGYNTSTQSYPVIYVLHGKFYFKYGVAYAERLASQGNIPNAIVVGVPQGKDDNPYLVYGQEKTNRFLGFMEKEVFPFVESNFRTTNHRTVVGWHHTAAFALHALVHSPQTFDGYIVASPTSVPTNPVDLENLAQKLAGSSNTKKTLYFGADPVEVFLGDNVENLEGLLKTASLESLIWHADKHPGDTEFTDTVYRLMHPGLREVYRDSKFPHFNDLSEFEQWGGLAYLEHFLAARGKKYGTSAAISPQIVFTLLRLARMGDDLTLFEKALDMANIFTLEWNVNWYVRFANFYLKHGKTQEALAFYKETTVLYPQNVSSVAGLARAYEMNGQQDIATATYAEALLLAQQQSDRRVEELREKLNALNGRE